MTAGKKVIQSARKSTRPSSKTTAIQSLKTVVKTELRTEGRCPTCVAGSDSPLFKTENSALNFSCWCPSWRIQDVIISSLAKHCETLTYSWLGFQCQNWMFWGAKYSYYEIRLRCLRLFLILRKRRSKRKRAFSCEFHHSNRCVYLCLSHVGKHLVLL